MAVITRKTQIRGISVNLPEEVVEAPVVEAQQETSSDNSDELSWLVDLLFGEPESTDPTTQQEEAPPVHGRSQHTTPDSSEARWTSTARAQWSRHPLHAVEKFSVGGQYSVRGFKGQSLSGDSGLWWRNDLRLTLPPTTLGPIDRTLGRAYVGLSYDIGKIKTDPRDRLERGIASGISASLGTSGGPLSLSLTWAQEVRSPAFLTAKNNAVYFSASLTF